MLGRSGIMQTQRYLNITDKNSGEGGRIEVDSKEGVGTVFTLSLPAAPSTGRSDQR